MSPSSWRRLPATRASSATRFREKPHEGRRCRRCRPSRHHAERVAPPDHQDPLVAVRRAGRQGGLARCALPCRHRRARARRTGPPTHRAASRRSPPAARQVARHLRLDAVPTISKAQVQAVAAGDAWLAQGANLLFFGPPGGGKSHLAAAIGLALVENGCKVLFTRTTDLVQKLQLARRDLALEATINRLDRFDLLILDDLAYVTKDQAETSVLFELISARYERRSLLITANQPFGEWGKVFPDPAMTLAAIDRLVHHAAIFEMNVESYRRRVALERKRGPGRPPTRATPKTADN
jgi:DNA replication protein DnaC